MTFEDHPPALTESAKYNAYYYQDDAPGEGVLILGDSKKAQDRFEEVCKVADAIMATYRKGQ